MGGRYKRGRTHNTLHEVTNHVDVKHTMFVMIPQHLPAPKGTLKTNNPPAKTTHEDVGPNM
jgi:hypothetical protein